MSEKLQSGMMVTLKKRYHENAVEVFKLSQADDFDGNRAWASNINGFGWYIKYDHIDTILAQSEDVTDDCETCNGDCYVADEDDDGHKIWKVCPDCDGCGGTIDDDYGYNDQKNFD